MINFVIQGLFGFLGKLAAIAAFFFLSKEEGRKEERIKTMKQEAVDAQRREKEKSSVIGMSDNAVALKLHDRAESKRDRKD